MVRLSLNGSMQLFSRGRVVDTAEKNREDIATGRGEEIWRKSSRNGRDVEPPGCIKSVSECFSFVEADLCMTEILPSQVLLLDRVVVDKKDLDRVIPALAFARESCRMQGEHAADAATSHLDQSEGWTAAGHDQTSERMTEVEAKCGHSRVLWAREL